MLNEIAVLVDKYQAWLRDKTVLRQLANHVEITTPFMDRHNDYLQIYVKKENGGYVLTDDGYIVEDLELSGCMLHSPKRQSLLKTTLAGFGVLAHDDVLMVKATADNFSLRKHNLIQAMLAVNDLFYLAKPHIASVFLEDVTTWLDFEDIRYVPKVKFTGKTGYDHMFDFAVAKSRQAPERLLRVVNHPTKDTAQQLILSWIDTKDARASDSKAYAILNDNENQLASGVIEALRSYEVIPVSWSARENVKEALAA